MKRYNLCVKKVYTKNGEEKVLWNNIGAMVYFPPTAEKHGGFKMELNMFPSLNIYVFEQKPKVITPVHTEESQDAREVNPDDIPF